MSKRRVFPRIGQGVLCAGCNKARLFGYGPRRNCGHQPNPEAVDAIRREGIVVDDNGLLIREPQHPASGPGKG